MGSPFRPRSFLIVFILIWATLNSVRALPTLAPPPALQLVPQERKNETSDAVAAPDILRKHPFPTCRREVEKCEHVPNATCLDLPLPYDHISYDLVGLSYYWDVQAKLDQWRPLMSVPKCWPLIQQLLCSVYMPKCDNETVSVELIQHSLCKATRGPCRIVKDLFTGGWPDFMNCDNEDIYAKECNWVAGRYRGPVSSGISSQGLGPSFLNTTSGTCISPLVPTKKEAAYFHDFDECGMRCQSPLYGGDDTYESVHARMGYLGTVGAISFAICVLTHLLAGWSNVNKYPNVIIFYMGICWLVIFLGILLQFIPGYRERTVCEPDGTRRLHGTVGEGNSGFCTASFVLLYFPTIALLLWFIILSYCWHQEATNATGTGGKTLDKRTPYLHMTAWLVPFTLTFGIVVFNMTEADSLFGVCFVTQEVQIVRTIVFILPLVLTIVISAFFNYLTFKTLVSIVKSSKEVESKSASKVRHVIAKRGIFIFMIYISLLYVIIFDLYKYFNQDVWNKAMKDYLLCLARKNFYPDKVIECELASSPTKVSVDLLLLALLTSALAVFAWMLSRRTYAIWRDAWRKLFRCNQSSKHDASDARHLGKKHDIIRRVYEQRDKLQEQGRVSLSLPSMSGQIAGGPVGMNVMQDTSAEFDSSFVAAIPRLVNRRNAIIDLASGAPGEQSAAVGGGGLSSQMHSIDSQMSIQPNELEHLRSLYKATSSAKSRSRLRKKFLPKRRSKVHRRISISSVTSVSSGGSRMRKAAVTLEKGFMSDSISGVSSSVMGTSMGMEMTEIKNKPVSYSEVKEKLKHLNTSADTSINKLSMKDDGSSESETTRKRILQNASVQTSWTDLTPSRIVSPSKDDARVISVGTQCEDDDHVSVVTSSDHSHIQLPEHYETKALRHIEPNVIRIAVHSDQDSTTTPSSMDFSSSKFLMQSSGKENKGDPNSSSTSIGVGGDESNNDSLLFRQPLHREFHNRARRGGIIELGTSPPKTKHPESHSFSSSSHSVTARVKSHPLETASSTS